MKSMRFFLFACCVVCLLAASAQAADKEDTDLSGVYSYGEGKVTLIRQGDESYEYREDHGKGGLWVGVGIYRDGVLAVAWHRASDGKNLGVSQLKAEKGAKGPRLVGVWANYPEPGKGWGKKVGKYDPALEYIGPVEK